MTALNIAIFSRRLPQDFLGGAEIHALLTAQALAKRGHRVRVVAGGKRDTKTKRGGLTIIRLRRFSYPSLLQTFLLPYWRFRFRQRVKRLVADADIVHAFDLESILLLSGWKAVERKLIATIQDYSVICPAGDLLPIRRQVCACHRRGVFTCRAQFTGSPLRRLYAKVAYPLRFAVRSRAFLQARHVVFISDFVRREFGRVFADRLPTQTPVIGNFIPDSWLSGKFAPPQRMAIDVLFVGRVALYKGVEVFLKALALMVRRRRLRVCIVGAGDLERYQGLAARLGVEKHVSFAGPVAYPAVRSYYLRSKIVVVPSIWPEPCGRSVIEGMSLGRVVVATASGGTPELVQDGVTGFLIPPGDARALARCLDFVLRRYPTLRSLRFRARQHVRSTFVTRIILQQLTRIYHEVSR